jgi:hypothetical protein
MAWLDVKGLMGLRQEALALLVAAEVETVNMMMLKVRRGIWAGGSSCDTYAVGSISLPMLL